MVQIKIHGLRPFMTAHRQSISDAIHASAIEALQLPESKRFHRFFPLEPEDFIFPQDRSDRYTIIEISMFAGRSVETRKQFIRGIIARLETDPGIAPMDVELTIVETPRENWGIRGMTGDELSLDYKVTV